MGDYVTSAITLFPSGSDLLVLAGAALVATAIPVMWWALSGGSKKEASRHLQSATTVDLHQLLLTRSAEERVVGPIAASIARKVRRFSREFAVLPDQDLLDTLSNSLNKLSAIAQHMEKGLDPAGAQRDLGYVRRWSTGLHADVNGRLPVEERVGLPGARAKDPGEDEDPEDEDPEDEDR